MTDPKFIYGTAWKEEETERLTRLAIDAGFRAIDTANQRRHYHEVGVGAADAGRLSIRMVFSLSVKLTVPPRTTRAQPSGTLTVNW